jgi:hypothetical protein
VAKIGKTHKEKVIEEKENKKNEKDHEKEVVGNREVTEEKRKENENKNGIEMRMRKKTRRIRGMYHFQTNLKNARVEIGMLVVERVAMTMIL